MIIKILKAGTYKMSLTIKDLQGQKHDKYLILIAKETIIKTKVKNEKVVTVTKEEVLSKSEEEALKKLQEKGKPTNYVIGPTIREDAASKKAVQIFFEHQNNFDDNLYSKN